jgi:phosphate starvation-inducible PhoH-like protein
MFYEKQHKHIFSCIDYMRFGVSVAFMIISLFRFSVPFGRGIGGRGRMGGTRLFTATKRGSGNGKNALRTIAPQYKPKTVNQELYLQYLRDKNFPVVFGVGPAGCGKTLFACITAVNELISGNIQKIILTRPIVSVEEEEIGFLPGNLVSKMDPWTRPIFDILLEFYQQKDLDLMLNSGIIEISPLSYMRGRTFKNAFIIADEMQNSTPNQMLMLTTRIGENSKLIVTGDLNQSDRLVNNGLSDIITKVAAFGSSEPLIRIIRLNHTDVRRSLVVSQILEIYGGGSTVNNSNVVNGRDEHCCDHCAENGVTDNNCGAEKSILNNNCDL